MSEQSEGPPSEPEKKPMAMIEQFRIYTTEIPNLVGLGFETPLGSVLLAANRKRVLEMIAKLKQVAGIMKEPS